MQKLLLFAFFSFLLTGAYAQRSPLYLAEVQKLITDVRASKDGKGWPDQLIDSPRYDRITLSDFRQNRNAWIQRLSDTLFNYNSLNNKIGQTATPGQEFILLSNVEVQRFIDAIEEPPRMIWTRELTGASYITTQACIDSCFSVSSNDIFRGWGCAGSYMEMSLPLFFRNYTLCAFYWGYACGMTCGWGMLSIYRKENGHWVRVITLSEWES